MYTWSNDLGDGWQSRIDYDEGVYLPSVAQLVYQYNLECVWTGRECSTLDQAHDEVRFLLDCIRMGAPPSFVLQLPTR